MLRKLLPEQFRPEKLEAYIAKEILPEAGLADRPFTVEPTTLGNRNVIFFLHVKDSPVIVLKGFRKKKRLERSLIASRFLERCNINVPKTLTSDLSKKTCNRFGCNFSCEEKIEGKNLSEIDNTLERISEVAVFYAKLHNIRSSRWGKFTSGKKFGFSRYNMGRISKWLSFLKDTGDRFSSENIAACLSWFEKRKDSINAVKHFSLCHGDANKKNILFSKSQGVFIIDNEAVRYQHFPIEFYRLMFSLCEDNAEVRRSFEKCYFDACPPQRRAEFEKCSDFYRAYVLLELSGYYSQKLKTNVVPQELKAFYESNLTKYLETLKKQISMKS